MFDDNIVVNNVYRKINELEALKSEQSEDTISGLTILKVIIFFTIFSLIVIVFDLIAIKYLINAYVLILLFMIIQLPIAIRKDYKNYKNNLLASKKLKNEICDYLSKPHVQKELVKFTQLTFGDRTIDELKKLFASKEHMGAYLYVTQIIKKFLEIEQQKLEQAKNEEMIQQYEKNMKKASRAKLRLVS